METKLINFTIPKLLLKDIDFLRRKKRTSRSELLREAVRIYLEKETIKDRAFAIIKQAAGRNNLSQKTAISLAEKAKSWARREKI